jgi:hypothetical protein
MRRVSTLVIVVAILLAPSLIFAAANNFVAGKAMSKEVNTVVVPLVISNENNLTALDIPIKYSDGVTLKEVTFENTRTDYFDLKIYNINADDQSVVIGLLPQLSANPKPDLEAGTGPVANLVFEINDPSVNEITLNENVTENPGHFLAFVYHDVDANGVSNVRMERVEFPPVTVALSDMAPANNLPTSYSLGQNYPNPFNPSTNISYDVPKASHVTLEVYNVLGQRVASLVDQEMEAGNYTVEFDGSSISSGIYFYRLNADDFTQTKKMVMVK